MTENALSEWDLCCEDTDGLGHELCVFGGNDTVEKEFSHQHVSGWRGNFARVIDAVATDNKTCSVLFFFLRSFVAYKRPICDILSSILWDVALLDELDGVGAFDADTDSIR